MRRIIFGLSLLAALLASAPAPAQNTTGLTVATCGSPPTAFTATRPGPFTVDTGGQLCITGSISASLSGFAPATQGTPVAATTGGNTQTLPVGAVVVATNVGTTNAAYCRLGASATTDSQYIAPNGGWFAFTVGANTQITCVTSTSTTTVNTAGGAGLPTGTGGGGGSGGGGGGAITAASGSYASGALSSGSVASGAYASGSIGSGAMVDLGAIADAAATAGSTGTVSAKLRLATTQLATINTTLGTPFQAGGSIGNTTFGATQGNAGSNAQAWWTRIGDATNGPAAVKAASTAPAATDPALVVSISPNSVNANGQATMANSAPVVVASNQSAIPVSGAVNVTPTTCSGTIATGGTAQNAITAGATLHGFTIANIDTSEVLWINFIGTAAASGTDSFPLAPATATTFAALSSYTTPVGAGYNTNLSVIAATSAHKFSCSKW